MGINVEKYNRFKKLKVKIIKKGKIKKQTNKQRKKEKQKKKKTKRGGISTDLQKPKVDAEVYNNNKKCD